MKRLKKGKSRLPIKSDCLPSIVDIDRFIRKIHGWQTAYNCCYLSMYLVSGDVGYSKFVLAFASYSDFLPLAKKKKKKKLKSFFDINITQYEQ